MIRSKMMNRHGVVLLVVLAALILISTALVAVARSVSMSRIASIRAQAALQHRWGMLSCERAVLPAANGTFAGSDAVARATASRGERQPLPRRLTDRVLLGGQSFDLILSDEDAKANLNAIFDASGLRESERALNLLVGLDARQTIRLQPRRSSLANRTAADSQKDESRLAGDVASDDSTAEDESDESLLDEPSIAPPAFTSWGEVFDYSAIDQVAGDIRHLSTMTQKLTLWGNGKLNVWRAEDDTIVAVCAGVVQNGLARRIVQRMRTSSLSQIDLILQQTVTNAEDRTTLSTMLSDASLTSSLWIEGVDGQVRRQRMSILTIDDRGRLQTRTFVFP